MTVEAALRLKGLEYERVDLSRAPHTEEMEAIYGEGSETVPGLMVDGEPVHGSRPILARLEELAPEPPLYPGADRRRGARGRALGRRGAPGPRPPAALGRAALPPRGDGHASAAASRSTPPGTDFAIAYVRATWKYHRITAERLAEDLAGLPAKLDHVDAARRRRGRRRREPNAADLQIGATLRVLLTVGDLRPLIEGRPAERVARRWFPDYPARCRPARSRAAGFRRGPKEYQGRSLTRIVPLRTPRYRVPLGLIEMPA